MSSSLWGVIFHDASFPLIAAIVPNAIARGALSAVLLVGKPPVPLRPVANVADGVDYALERLRESGVRLPKPADLLRFEVLRELKEAGGAA